MKKQLKKALCLILTVIVCTISMLSLVGCSKTQSAEINISGSSSVSPLMQKLAAAYEEKNENITIVVTTSDSSTGISEAKEGKNDFGMASKGVKEDVLTTVQIATDGVALVVNKNSSVENITPVEVYELYANGTAIQTSIVNAVSREEGSGTRDAFDGLIKNANGEKLSSVTSFASCVSIQNATGTVKQVISSNSAANTIGYISMGSLDDSVKALKINGVEPTSDNVKNNTYSLSRPFNIVYNTEKGLTKEAKDFLDFILSEEGQKIVVSNGYITIA